MVCSVNCPIRALQQRLLTRQVNLPFRDKGAGLGCSIRSLRRRQVPDPCGSENMQSYRTKLIWKHRDPFQNILGMFCSTGTSFFF